MGRKWFVFNSIIDSFMATLKPLNKRPKSMNKQRYFIERVDVRVCIGIKIQLRFSVISMHDEWMENVQLPSKKETNTSQLKIYIFLWVNSIQFFFLLLLGDLAFPFQFFSLFSIPLNCCIAITEGHIAHTMQSDYRSFLWKFIISKIFGTFWQRFLAISTTTFKRSISFNLQDTFFIFKYPINIFCWDGILLYRFSFIFYGFSIQSTVKIYEDAVTLTVIQNPWHFHGNMEKWSVWVCVCCIRISPIFIIQFTKS